MVTEIEGIPVEEIYVLMKENSDLRLKLAKDFNGIYGIDFLKDSDETIRRKLESVGIIPPL
jgi:hypothetical protein